MGREATAPETGFTAIEFLIYTSIAALLLSFAAPLVNRSINQSQVDQAMEIAEQAQELKDFLLDAIDAGAGPWLEARHVFDVYRGAGIAEGQLGVSFPGDGFGHDIVPSRFGRVKGNRFIRTLLAVDTPGHQQRLAGGTPLGFVEVEIEIAASGNG